MGMNRLPHGSSRSATFRFLINRMVQNAHVTLTRRAGTYVQNVGVVFSPHRKVSLLLRIPFLRRQFPSHSMDGI